jgi:hypothetical protein
VAPGHYVSNTPQGRYVHFDVNADGRSLTNLRIEYNLFCKPPAEIENQFVTVSGNVPISSSRAFQVNASNADRTLVVTLQGVFDALNNVSGQFRGQQIVMHEGVRYECDSGLVPFQGRRG